jgi:hypothetical protein
MDAMSVLGGSSEAAAILRDGAAHDGETVARILFEALEAEGKDAGIADIWHYGISVEMVLTNGEYWAIECFGPDAFHFYPGVVGEGSVTWANVWVAPDYTLDKLIERLSAVTASARGKTLNA